MDKSIETTMTYSYENKGVTLNFSLTSKEKAQKFIVLMEQALKDIKKTYDI